MKIQSYTTKSPEETIEIGARLGRNLKGGDVVCLTGDLGGGKTHFAKGIAGGLGIDQTIISPTFVLMRVYERGDAPNLYHLDLYRIKDKEDLEPLDTEDIIGDERAITIIEWPEKIRGIIPENAIWVKFKFIDENTREIEIRSEVELE